MHIIEEFDLQMENEHFVLNADLCYTDPINYYIFLQLSFSPILYF